MQKIRLRRTGRKKIPCYDIVVADSKAPRDGKFKEKLGYLNAHTKDFFIDCDKIDQYMKNGAQPTNKVKYIYKLSKKAEKSKQ